MGSPDCPPSPGVKSGLLAADTRWKESSRQPQRKKNVTHDMTDAVSTGQPSSLSTNLKNIVERLIRPQS